MPFSNPVPGSDELQAAGATAVIPETLEASLTLTSHVPALLDIPASRISSRMQGIRDHRYSVLRNIFRREDARPIDETHSLREELKTVSLPAGAHAVDRRLGDLNLRDAAISATAIRREGIVGHQPDLRRTGRRKLLYLHDAADLRDLRLPPGNRLEGLKGRWKGFHSIRINDQWRVVFRWKGGNAFEVQIVDYH